jgi:hypothetical protein
MLGRKPLRIGLIAVLGVGITRVVVAIVVLLVLEGGGDDGRASEQGVQGVDDGAVGSVRGCVCGGVAGAWLYAVDDVVELRQVGRLSRWLVAGGYGAGDLTCGLVEEFLLWQRAGGRHRSEWSRLGLGCLLGVLRGLGVLAGEEPAPPGSLIDLLLASLSGTWSASGVWRWARSLAR